MRPRQIDQLGYFSAGGSPILGLGGSGIVLAKSAVPVSLVEPALTFTNASPSSAAGGADTLLTSAGVHGLTAAVSVGASIYISGGTGWTVGFHTITAIAVDTTGTTIQIDTPFDVGMGTPTIALANTEVTLVTIDIPPLLENSLIYVDSNFSSPDTTATQKIPRVKHNGNAYFSVVLTTTPQVRNAVAIHNRGVTNSQIGGAAIALTAGYGNSGSMPPSYSVDTSVATSITLTAQPTAANVVMSLNRYLVELFL